MSLDCATVTTGSPSRPGRRGSAGVRAVARPGDTGIPSTPSPMELRVVPITLAVFAYAAGDEHPDSGRRP